MSVCSLFLLNVAQLCVGHTWDGYESGEKMTHDNVLNESYEYKNLRQKILKTNDLRVCASIEIVSKRKL